MTALPRSDQEAGPIPLPGAGPRPDDGVPALSVRDLTVRFGDVVANDGVHLDVVPGEVHAVLGENGAGKSTLVKAICGLYRPAAGTIAVHGVRLPPGSTVAARGAGIGVVYQDLRLVPALTVAENVWLALGRQAPSRRRLLDKLERVRTERGITVPLHARVRDLSLGQRQQVEILRALTAGARVLLLDEPTSALAPQEVAALFDGVRALKRNGIAIVIITHKLREIEEIADRMTVLRGGRVVVSGARAGELQRDELVTAMVGERVVPVSRAGTRGRGEAVLQLRSVSTAPTGGRRGLDNVSLTVHSGEILGIAGVAGSGQRELVEVCTGLRSSRQGSVVVDGHVFGRDAARGAVRSGVADIPEDPYRDAVIPGMKVLEHFGLAMRLPAGRRLGLRFGVDWRGVDTRAGQWDERAALRVAPRQRILAHLSGGNIQRVLLTAALSVDAKLVVAAYPARGLDVLTTNRTHELLLARREEGAAVLLISEDLDELFSLSDRVAVLHAGRVAGVLPVEECDHARVGRLMVGAA